jgi:hypothetical protein
MVYGIDGTFGILSNAESGSCSVIWILQGSSPTSGTTPIEISSEVYGRHSLGFGSFGIVISLAGLSSHHFRLTQKPKNDWRSRNSLRQVRAHPLRLRRWASYAVFRRRWELSRVRRAKVNALSAKSSFVKDSDGYYQPTTDSAGNGSAILRFLPPGICAILITSRHGTKMRQESGDRGVRGTQG